MIDVGEITCEKRLLWEKKYIQKKDGFHCPKCDSIIQQTTCYVSVYFREFRELAGGGEVRHIPYPYCPECDGKPDHVSGYIKEPYL